jgi:hypothetical protein
MTTDDKAKQTLKSNLYFDPYAIMAVLCTDIIDVVVETEACRSFIIVQLVLVLAGIAA